MVTSRAETPLVSIIVPARNEAASIEASVRGLLAQTYPTDRIEVLVVDGLSNDGTAEIVRNLAAGDSRVRLFVNPERITPTALNAGIRAARGDVIGLMSAHAVPAPDYLARAIAALTDTGAWGVGGRIARTSATPTQLAIAAATGCPRWCEPAKRA